MDTIDRYKLGRTEYLCEVRRFLPDAGEPETLHNTSFDREDLAVAWFNSEGIIRAGRLPDVHFEIERGTWIADDFDDDEYGTIYDVEWKEEAQRFGYVDLGTGTVNWDAWEIV